MNREIKHPRPNRRMKPAPKSGKALEQWERWHLHGCGRCGRHGYVAARWPDGHVCRTCQSKALRIRGICQGCQTERMPPGRGKNGEPICTQSPNQRRPCSSNWPPTARTRTPRPTHTPDGCSPDDAPAGRSTRHPARTAPPTRLHDRRSPPRRPPPTRPPSPSTGHRPLAWLPRQQHHPHRRRSGRVLEPLRPRRSHQVTNEARRGTLWAARLRPVGSVGPHWYFLRCGRGFAVPPCDHVDREQPPSSWVARAVRAR